MVSVKAGDRVGIVKRSVTAEDEKSGMYYTYFGGLIGTVDKVYDDSSACIDIDIDSLPEDSRARHKAMEERERQRWLESLSGEARSRLTPEQKQLKMSYKLLVSRKDLQPVDSDKPGGSSRPALKSNPEGSSETRKSEADLSAAEEEYMRSLTQKKDV